MVSAILQLVAKYQVEHVRTDLIRGLSTLYPKTLAQWEKRETKVTSPSGEYDPRKTLSHPMCVIFQLSSRTTKPSVSLVINLARAATCPITAGTHHLSDNDLLVLLRGKENASRFLSTFIVKELQERDVSVFCQFQSELDTSRKRSRNVRDPS